ncbi:MAG: hypothetical protein D3924_01345 [Candidatus Electrothrix sp. AR4]|nr:hypothetical protein [Candidatus Electrothrix sp. AR4]
MTTCPRCRKKTEEDKCGTCNIVFAEYAREKMERTGQVYKLISASKLQDAKELAEKLSLEFPDSKGDFVLLISNINRDLNISKKYQNAQELFNQGDYNQTVLLLRNIKAFDPGLEEKVISLRRKAEQHSGYDSKFEQAVEHLKKEEHGAAWTLFQQLDSQKHKHKDAVRMYRDQLKGIKNDTLEDISDRLGNNLFDTAYDMLNKLTQIFPEVAQEQAGLFSLLEQKKETCEILIEVAHKARKEQRFLEAKALYRYLCWQNHELKPKLLPYIEEIGSQAIVSLADCQLSGSIDFEALGLLVNEEGFLKPILTERKLTSADYSGKRLPYIDAVHLTPEPLADPPKVPLDIDGEEVPDFV